LGVDLAQQFMLKIRAEKEEKQKEEEGRNRTESGKSVRRNRASAQSVERLVINRSPHIALFLCPLSALRTVSLPALRSHDSYSP